MPNTYSNKITCDCGEPATAIMPDFGEYLCPGHAADMIEEGEPVRTLTTNDRRKRVLEAVQAMWPMADHVEVPDELPTYVAIEEDTRGSTGNWYVWGNIPGMVISQLGDTPEFPPVEFVNLDTGEAHDIEARYEVVGLDG